MALNVVVDFILKPYNGEATLWSQFEEDIKADIYSSTLIGTRAKEFLFENYNYNETTNSFEIPRKFKEEEVLEGLEGLETILVDGVDEEVTSDMIKMRRDHIKVQEASNKIIAEMKSTLFGIVRRKISPYLKKILDVGCERDILYFWKQIETSYGPNNAINEDSTQKFYDFLSMKMNHEERFDGFVTEFLRRGEEIELTHSLMRSVLLSNKSTNELNLQIVLDRLLPAFAECR